MRAIETRLCRSRVRRKWVEKAEQAIGGRTWSSTVGELSPAPLFSARPIGCRPRPRCVRGCSCHVVPRPLLHPARTRAEKGAQLFHCARGRSHCAERGTVAPPAHIKRVRTCACTMCISASSLSAHTIAVRTQVTLFGPATCITKYPCATIFLFGFLSIFMAIVGINSLGVANLAPAQLGDYPASKLVSTRVDGLRLARDESSLIRLQFGGDAVEESGRTGGFGRRLEQTTEAKADRMFDVPHDQLPTQPSLPWPLNRAHLPTGSFAHAGASAPTTGGYGGHPVQGASSLVQGAHRRRMQSGARQPKQSESLGGTLPSLAPLANAAPFSSFRA